MLKTDVRAACFGNLMDINIKQICAAIHPPQGISSFNLIFTSSNVTCLVK